MKIAVLITVFNRKEVTINGIVSLKESIQELGEGYEFDIYLTDDGSTDGTEEVIKKRYPDTIIIKGDGNLYWGGGMRKSWQTAIGSGKDYNFYLWFNDDAALFKDALQTLFESYKLAGNDSIISGAFCDKEGKVSYGGKSMKRKLIQPSGKIQPIQLMNGNLVLVPTIVVEKIGIISSVYRHGYGDFDYGLRAQKNGIGVYLTMKYVGITDRHDDDIPKYTMRNLNLISRCKLLYNPRFSPSLRFRFNYTYYGLIPALKTWLRCHVRMLSPQN